MPGNYKHHQAMVDPFKVNYFIRPFHQNAFLLGGGGLRFCSSHTRTATCYVWLNHSESIGREIIKSYFSLTICKNHASPLLLFQLPSTVEKFAY